MTVLLRVFSSVWTFCTQSVYRCLTVLLSRRSDTVLSKLIAITKKICSMSASY